MPEYLVFTLAAALGSMGELAGHERRGSLLWPGRSAVLGLVAAALGIRRDESARLAALDRWSVSVSVLSAGVPLRDYHTVQTVPTAAARRPDSRPAALRTAGRRVNTTITLRDYRVAACYGVALRGGDEPEAVAAALERPSFALYLGRKACPLAAPLAPRRVEAAGPRQALAEVRLPPWIEADPARPALIATDPDAAGPEARVEIRHDRATDRQRWHFAPRRVAILTEPSE